MLSKLRNAIKRRRALTNAKPALPEFRSVREPNEGLHAFLDRSQREADAYFAQYH